MIERTVRDDHAWRARRPRFPARRRGYVGARGEGCARRMMRGGEMKARARTYRFICTGLITGREPFSVPIESGTRGLYFLFDALFTAREPYPLAGNNAHGAQLKGACGERDAPTDRYANESMRSACYGSPREFDSRLDSARHNTRSGGRGEIIASVCGRSPFKVGTLAVSR